MIRRFPIADTPFFNTAVQRYCAGDAALKPFYNFPPTLDAVAEAVAAKRNQKIDRKLLVERLLAQYEPLRNEPHYENARAQIELLQHENTFTITTAHQPHLFLGPLYVTCKIVSVIRLAQQCNERFPDLRFVPVLWMGSEDHDLDELGNVTVYDKTISIGETTYRGAFGRFPTAMLAHAKEEFYRVLGNAPQATSVRQLFNETYFEQPTVAVATRALAHCLFGEHGLVVVDGDDAELKKVLVPAMLNEANAQLSYKTVTRTIEELEQIGVHAQAQPREVNLFYLQDGLRERIVKQGETFAVNNTDIHFSKEQLVANIQSHPASFSPNVILRPLYQSLTLPDVIFTGGPAEVNYWLELKPLFEQHRAAYPMVVLRDSFVYVDNNACRRMQKLGVRLDDLMLPIERWVENYLSQHENGNVNFDDFRARLDALMRDVTERMTQADSGFQPASVDAEKAKMAKSLDALEQKAQRAVKKKHETEIAQLQKLHAKLFPERQLAERRNALWEYLIANPDFINLLLQHADPFDASVKAIADVN